MKLKRICEEGWEERDCKRTKETLPNRGENSEPEGSFKHCRERKTKTKDATPFIVKMEAENHVIGKKWKGALERFSRENIRMKK